MSPASVQDAAFAIAGVQDFDLQYPRVIEEVKADVGLGQLLGVTATPTFFINGVRLVGAGAADDRPGHRLRVEEGGQDQVADTVHAIDTENLTKDYALGFWRKRPYRALDSPHARRWSRERSSASSARTAPARRRR